jgi:hypothetical protein
MYWVVRENQDGSVNIMDLKDLVIETISRETLIKYLQNGVMINGACLWGDVLNVVERPLTYMDYRYVRQYNTTFNFHALGFEQDIFASAYCISNTKQNAYWVKDIETKEKIDSFLYQPPLNIMFPGETREQKKDEFAWMIKDSMMNLGVYNVVFGKEKEEYFSFLGIGYCMRSRGFLTLVKTNANIYNMIKTGRQWTDSGLGYISSEHCENGVSNNIIHTFMDVKTNELYSVDDYILYQLILNDCKTFDGVEVVNDEYGLKFEKINLNSILCVSEIFDATKPEYKVFNNVTSGGVVNVKGTDNEDELMEMFDNLDTSWNDIIIGVKFENVEDFNVLVDNLKKYIKLKQTSMLLTGKDRRDVDRTMEQYKHQLATLEAGKILYSENEQTVWDCNETVSMLSSSHKIYRVDTKKFPMYQKSRFTYITPKGNYSMIFRETVDERGYGYKSPRMSGLIINAFALNFKKTADEDMENDSGYDIKSAYNAWDIPIGQEVQLDIDVKALGNVNEFRATWNTFMDEDWVDKSANETQVTIPITIAGVTFKGYELYPEIVNLHIEYEVIDDLPPKDERADISKRGNSEYVNGIAKLRGKSYLMFKKISVSGELYDFETGNQHDIVYVQGKKMYKISTHMSECLIDAAMYE